MIKHRLLLLLFVLITIIGIGSFIYDLAYADDSMQASGGGSGSGATITGGTLVLGNIPYADTTTSIASTNLAYSTDASTTPSIAIASGVLTYGVTTGQTVALASGTSTLTLLDTIGATFNIPLFVARINGATHAGAADGTITIATFRGGAALAGTNTDTAGAEGRLAPGAGTGTGAGAYASIRRNNMGTTGTVAQVQTPGYAVCETKTLSNTSATTTAIALLGLASNSAGAVRATISLRCSDGTNFDSDIITSYVAYVNKAGVVTIGTPVTTASAAANNSGSCTVAPTFVANGNGVDIKVTPVFTTIVPTTVTAILNIENMTAGAVTCN